MKQPKDMTRSEFAVWMSREIQIELMVEDLREMYPDLLLPDLRQRAADQLDAIYEVPLSLSGGWLKRYDDVAFATNIDSKSIQSNHDRDATAHFLTYTPTPKVPTCASNARVGDQRPDKVRSRALFSWLATLLRRISDR